MFIKKMIAMLSIFYLTFFGLAVMIGWLVNLPILFQINPVQNSVVFNTGLCFFLTGIALFICENRLFRAGQILLGLMIFIIAGLSLTQTLFSLDLHIDQLLVKVASDNEMVYPGRMAFNTSFAFIFSGLIFIFIPYSRLKIVAILVQIAIFIIFIIGVLGLIGYALKIDFLYSWYSYTQMALLSAMGFILLSASTWRLWLQTVNTFAWYRDNEEIKIIITGCGVVFLVALTAGLTSFVSITNQQNATLSHSFQFELQAQAREFQDDILRPLKEIDEIRNAYFPKLDPAKLPELVNLFVSQGFTTVRIFDKNGKEIIGHGPMIDRPELQVNLLAHKEAVLGWKNGWYFQVIIPVKDLGFVLLVWPLDSITEALDSSQQSLGKTAEYVICSKINEDRAECFPSRFKRHAFILQNHLYSRSLPMFAALDGKKGALITNDYKNSHVLAAYSPLASTDLGIVLKIDVSEIYMPVLKSFLTTIPIIILAMFAGILLLRLSVMPLIRKALSTEQKLLSINDQLHQSEERYNIAVAASHVGLWDWQVGTDKIYYSPILKKMLGYREDEIANSVSAFQERLHPDDREYAEKMLSQHIKTKTPYDIEYRLRAKNGDYHWFRVIGKAFWNKQDRAERMAGSIIDITDQKKAHQRLATQYVLTQLLSEATSFSEVAPKILRAICEGVGWDYGAVWLVDHSKQALRCVSVWSSPIMDFSALKESSVKLDLPSGKGLPGTVWSTAKPYWSCDPNDQANFPRYAVLKELNLNSFFGFPIFIGHNVLGVIEFFATGTKPIDDDVLQMMSTLSPQIGQFVQRKSVENELRESETHKSAILSSASDSIITINDKGIIVSYNPQVEKMFGLSNIDMLGKNINQLVPGLFAKLGQAQRKSPIEFLAKRENGELFPIELSISGMMVNDEHRYVSIIRDITERKKVEALKNEFISVVSHELRTPLTSIRGSIGLLLGGVVGTFSEKAKKLLEIAHNNCERLLLLINDILDIEKIEAGKMTYQMKPVEIDSVVQAAINMNQAYAEKFSVKLKLIKSAPGVMVNVDPDRLIQVLTNLISNAAKFSPPKQDVDIAVQTMDGTVQVAITDKGPGIPENFKSRIFHKFSQADGSNTRGQGGTGLGLSISKAIIEKFGGTLNFDSVANVKTSFYFELPRVYEDGNQAAKPVVIAPKSTLLICEDDEDQALYLSELLKSAGFSTDVAPTIGKAKELLSLHRYDALLLDLILPDQDGISFIRELRSKPATQDLPVIVISVITEAGRSLLNGDGLTVLDWLDKPVDFEKLLKGIRMIQKNENNRRPRVLHVEDDKDTQLIIKEILQKEAIIVDADTVEDAKNKLENETFDLVILDLILPDGNGVELLPLISQKHLPVIVFSVSELNESYAKSVNEVLVKTKTSSLQLLTMIKQVLAKIRK